MKRMTESKWWALAERAHKMEEEDGNAVLLTLLAEEQQRFENACETILDLCAQLQRNTAAIVSEVEAGLHTMDFVTNRAAQLGIALEQRSLAAQQVAKFKMLCNDADITVTDAEVL